MLALSLTPASTEGEPAWGTPLPSGDPPPQLTLRRWMEMLKPDTPAQHRAPYDGWRSDAR